MGSMLPYIAAPWILWVMVNQRPIFYIHVNLLICSYHIVALHIFLLSNLFIGHSQATSTIVKGLLTYYR